MFPSSCLDRGITRVGPCGYLQYTRAHYGVEAVGSSQPHEPNTSRMVAEPAAPTVPRTESPRSSHQQSGGQFSRATCCPFLPAMQTILKIVEIPQEQGATPGAEESEGAENYQSTLGETHRQGRMCIMQRQVATIRKSQKTDVNPQTQSNDEVVDVPVDT